jgi:tungstate transport system substrate-binding protein
MGKRGDADVLLVHAPAAEEAYMAKDRGLSRALVMHNAFMVVGPPSDPAHVKGTAAAQEAFAAIARGQAPFVSRADDSGTNIKELALWKAASVTPAGAWYIKTGGGMADALHVASQKAAYTLTDDGTYFSQRATLSLTPLVEDAKDLRNFYHVIVVKPLAGRVSNEPGGEAFAKFVTSAEGQRIIATYGRERFGRPLFTPDAGKGPPSPKLRRSRLQSPPWQRSSPLPSRSPGRCGSCTGGRAYALRCSCSSPRGSGYRLSLWDLPWHLHSGAAARSDRGTSCTRLRPWRSRRPSSSSHSSARSGSSRCVHRIRRCRCNSRASAFLVRAVSCC